MFDKINFMDDTHIYFGIKEGVELKTNLLSAHVVISDSEKHVLGEIVEVSEKQVKARLLGEFENGKLVTDMDLVNKYFDDSVMVL